MSKYDIDDFNGVAIYKPADEYPNSWSQMPALKAVTTIYHSDWKEDNFTTKEAGKMILCKLNKDVDVLDVSDSTSGDDGEVGVAIHDTLHPDWDEIDVDEMNEDVLYAGNPFIVSWFEIEEQYRKKRLGHALLHVALQSSGCEGHSVFFLPSPNPDHAGFEFLTKFYLDADLGNFVVKNSRIVCCSNYNSSDSVPHRRKQRSEEEESTNEITK
jgi:hypothetical protein